MSIHSHVSTLFLLLLVSLLSGTNAFKGYAFPIKEATVHDFHVAFKQNKLTSRQLVEFYLGEIHRLNPILRGVIEVNPDALLQADKADYERKAKLPGSLMGLHGIPILLKDNIATKDKMNTTAGSFALLKSVVPRDAGVVRRLRKAGAIILGKASLSEWAGFRFGFPYGWCARTGQGRNPYVLSATPCGSSSGSAISVAANLAAVTLGTETDGSILCPSHVNSVVGIKPTLGLTSRAGVVPISPRQDSVGSIPISGHEFSIKEATVHDFQMAFKQHKLTSRQLVRFYLGEIHKLNPILRGVIEVNPDALLQANKADRERKAKSPRSLQGLHGIPVLLKDNIATKDKMNTTAGSFALLKSVVPRDAGVVRKLRKAGAIILGKASMSEWAGLRFIKPYGWCARTGQGRNPYVLSVTPYGSSSGSAISVAANLAAVTLGTETQGSILYPSHINSVVGIKPTVGLTSRAGVVPVSPRQDTVGPICRTVSDAVEVLDVIVGFDKRDKATKKASKYIPKGGYKQFLKVNGLKGKRLGIVRNPIFMFENGSVLSQVFEHHFHTLRQGGAILVDNLEIANIGALLGSTMALGALEADLKKSLNAYLKELVASPVRTLADVIAFNNKFSQLEKVKEYGQDLLLQAQATKGINKKKLSKLARLSRNGFEKLMKRRKLDALVAPGPLISIVLSIGGFPGIVVPAGYDSKGVPFGFCFAGLKGSEPKLIEITYSFEQATKIRKPPSFNP